MHLHSTLASITFFVNIFIVVVVVAVRYLPHARVSSFVGALLLLALPSFVIVAALRFSCPTD